MIRRRAFTLVELLVVIGIIALLIGILLPTLNSARRQAKRIKASSDVRQLMVAYTAYHTDNGGWLLWGYPPVAVNGKEVRAYDPVTNVPLTVQTVGFTAAQVIGRYPWRLVQYFPSIWPVMYSNSTVPTLTRRGDSQNAVRNKAYELSNNSAYGLNATYVGGTRIGVYPSFNLGSITLYGTTAENGTPITGKHCVFRASEVRAGSNLLVFAESQYPNTVSGLAEPNQGIPYLMPPRASGEVRWEVVGNEKIRWKNPGGTPGGLPQGRYGDRTVVGFFDGHVSAMLPSELADMRYWCVKATTPDYTYPPL